jgi:uncharacterized protein YunC (DUF1805 family)
MCGYLDMQASDRFSDFAVIVKGVKSIDELLSKEVSEVSKQASSIGIKAGMTGREALSRLV